MWTEVVKDKKRSKEKETLMEKASESKITEKKGGVINIPKHLQSSIKQTSSSISDKGCFKCGMMGHLSRDCTNEKSKQLQNPFKPKPTKQSFLSDVFTLVDHIPSTSSNSNNKKKTSTSVALIPTNKESDVTILSLPTPYLSSNTTKNSTNLPSSSHMTIASSEGSKLKAAKLMKNPNVAAGGEEMIMRMGVQKEKKKKKKPSLLKKKLMKEREEKRKEGIIEKVNGDEVIDKDGKIEGEKGDTNVKEKGDDHHKEDDDDDENDDDDDDEEEKEHYGEGEGEVNEEMIKENDSLASLSISQNLDDSFAMEKSEKVSEINSFQLNSKLNSNAAPFVPSFLSMPPSLPPSLLSVPSFLKFAKDLNEIDKGINVQNFMIPMPPPTNPASAPITTGTPITVESNIVVNEKPNKKQKVVNGPSPLLTYSNPGERKKREYVDHELNKEIDTAVVNLLNRLIELDNKVRNTLEGALMKSKLRLTSGIREVQKGLGLNSIRLLIVAPNIENAEEIGSLNDQLKVIFKAAIKNNVNIIFALNRSKLAKVLKKKAHVSVIGVFDVSGTDQLYRIVKDLINDVRDEKNEYMVSLKMEVENERRIEEENLRREEEEERGGRVLFGKEGRGLRK